MRTNHESDGECELDFMGVKCYIIVAVELILGHRGATEWAHLRISV